MDKLEKKACVLPIFIFLSNQMNCEIIAKGKLGEEDRHFPIYIIFLDNVWETSLNEISLSLNFNGI